MFFSLGQAAKECGKSKATISKYIKNGKLSASLQDNGRYRIDASELFRVFPKSEQETVKNEQSQTPKINSVNSQLETEVELLRERLTDKNDVINDLRKRLDDENEERRKLTMMITDMRDKSPQKSVEDKENISGAIPAKNQKKLSSGQIWAIIALFILAILLAGAGGYYYSQLKPLSPPDSIQTIPQEQKQPSATFNNPVIPQSPLEYSSPVE